MSRRDRSLRAPSTALAIGCFVALLGSAARASVRPPQDAALEVERLLAEPPPERAEDLARKLAALGTPAAPPLIRALAGVAEREPLVSPLRETALDALELLPRSSVLSALDAALGPESPRAARCAALEILGRTGQRSEVSELVRFATPPKGSVERELDVEQAFERAASDWLARNPQSAALLAAKLPQVPPTMWIALARELGAALPPAELESLSALLGRTPGADVLLLGEIERLAARAPSAVWHEVRQAVRERLDDEDPLVCIAACRAVRALEDPEAVDGLIRLLGAEEEAVRTAAFDALRALTRQALDPQPELWSAWYSGELAWWQGDAQRHLTALRMGLKLEIAPALIGLARGVLFREEIAPALLGFLQHADSDVARLTASVLGTLGSRLAVPALAEALTSRDRTVASSAHKALRQIAGRDLGSRAEDWLALPH
jgi:HEAT repeat protein